MWRSFWRSIDRFSLQHFKYVINELRAIKVVDLRNRELVIDLLQSIVEIVTYGDRQDPMIFECFMEYQVLAEFVRLLKISKNSRIEAPLLQYLSIMIQNMDSEHAIYYCFSNDYVNNIIAHKYEFDGGDLAPYYVSFLRAVSSKINKDTLCLLVKVQEDAVVSFPLYSEALKFAHYEEKMIQTAVRALTLNIYNVSDDMVFQFITTPPVSKYFSDVVCRLRKQCLHLDTFLQAKEEMCTHGRRNELILETDKIVDDLYYLKDILSVSENRLGRFITQNIFSLLVFPILLPLLQLRQQIDGSNISEVTSLYIISRLIQVIGGKRVINAVAGVILYPYMNSSVGGATEGDTVDVNGNSFLNHLNDVEKLVCSGPETEGSENTSNYMFGHLAGHLAEHVSSDSQFVGGAWNDLCIERGGIFKYVFADNSPSLLLASLFLLLILAESKDLDYFRFPMIGRIQDMTTQAREFSASQRVDESIFVKFLPQILNALLKILASQPPLSVLIQWHTGWFFRKLLISQGNSLSDLNFQLFNTSYEQSRERLRKELDGCWFDRIPDTFRSEWSNCRTALEESSQCKDPFFALELAACREKTDGDAATLSALQRMVEAVKVFILHLQLKAFIFKGDLPEKPTLNSTTGPTADSGRSHTSDISSASFGSDVSLGSGIPCSISFSNAGIRDVYLVPAARGITGKLLLTEKHPFRSQRGVVIAIAPLAGLSPKIDKDHPSWLHLQIREFDPRFDTSKARGNHLKMSNHVADGRWTLGFPNAKACETARFFILEEIGKQRSFVESMLAPLLQDDFFGNLSDNQDE